MPLRKDEHYTDAACLEYSRWLYNHGAVFPESIYCWVSAENDMGGFEREVQCIPILERKHYEVTAPRMCDVVALVNHLAELNPDAPEILDMRDMFKDSLQALLPGNLAIDAFCLLLIEAINNRELEKKPLKGLTDPGLGRKVCRSDQ